MKTKFKVFLVLLTLFDWFIINVTCFSRYEGDVCVSGTKPGVCRKISECASAWNDLIARRIPPKIEDVCCFANREQVVCCPNTPAEVGKIPLPLRLQINETVRVMDAEYAIKKSKEMCAIYSSNLELRFRVMNAEEVKSPPKNRTTRSTNSVPADLITEDESEEEYFVQIRITGGHRADATEFPHMAAIGFNGSDTAITWACGGTLISDRYVLTAAHCLRDRKNTAQWVQLGSLLLDTDDPSSRYEIVEKIAHPEYKPPSLYNDIALLRLDRPVTLNHQVHPACLNTERVNTGLSCTATGWGITDWANSMMSEHLLKANIQVQQGAACNASFAPFFRSSRKLVNGIRDESLICAGDPTGRNDTCEGDSGGPIQVRVANSNNTYSVIGVTSFGPKACGNGSPGIYSRVSYFVPWIVSYVWPKESETNETTAKRAKTSWVFGQ